jgi:trehalose/maltose hydrolase-like predicted phosphorylase
VASHEKYDENALFIKGGSSPALTIKDKDYNPLYSFDSNCIIEDHFSLQNYLVGEAIFSLSNGYLGIRGSFEEGLSGVGYRTIPGTYLNGFYESVPIPHAERGYAYAMNTDTMLNVTDGKQIDLFLGEERVCLNEGKVLDYRRQLNIKEGLLTRTFTWRSPQGRDIKVTAKRLVSLLFKNLFAIQYQVEPLNFSDTISFHSVLNGAVDNHVHEEEDPRFSASLGSLGLSVQEILNLDTMATIISKTSRSGLTMAASMENRLFYDGTYSLFKEKTSSTASVTYRVDAVPGLKICLEKHVVYYTSRNYAAVKLSSLSSDLVSRAKVIGFEALLKKQTRKLKHFWQAAAIDIEGDPDAKSGVSFNLFHLRQAAGGNKNIGIAAKGLTSEGYDGHYFWDTEVYMMPFYAAVLPAEARKLLQYRYSTLDQARTRAYELSHPKGALYPWRTISGEEGSSYYPASTAQYHINAAIAFAICKYTEMTGDYSFTLDYGAEIIFETARLWEDLGAYISRKDHQFCYNEVTGPDEYTALVNNNCYTNLMARWHFGYACETAQTMQDNHPAAYNKLAEKIMLEDSEITAWQEAAAKMYIPYDDILKIHPQDDGFLDKKIWDFAGTPYYNYPLLLHYHPLVIYRYQVCKQPDVILAQLLLDDLFPVEQKRRDYQYYELITTHDSSLSPAIFSTAASELGFYDDAYKFFMLAARMDIDNRYKNTHHGIHLANMAGSWLALVYGFGGMRTTSGNLRFNPYLPLKWQGYSFRLIFKGALLELKVRNTKVTYSLLKGSSINFRHGDEELSLQKGEPVIRDLHKYPIEK